MNNDNIVFKRNNCKIKISNSGYIIIAPRKPGYVEEIMHGFIFENMSDAIDYMELYKLDTY